MSYFSAKGKKQNQHLCTFEFSGSMGRHVVIKREKTNASPEKKNKELDKNMGIYIWTKDFWKSPKYFLKILGYDRQRQTTKRRSFLTHPLNFLHAIIFYICIKATVKLYNLDCLNAFVKCFALKLLWIAQVTSEIPYHRTQNTQLSHIRSVIYANFRSFDNYRFCVAQFFCPRKRFAARFERLKVHK